MVSIDSSDHWIEVCLREAGDLPEKVWVLRLTTPATEMDACVDAVRNCAHKWELDRVAAGRVKCSSLEVFAETPSCLVVEIFGGDVFPRDLSELLLGFGGLRREGVPLIDIELD